jgi:hypothetical protein
MGTLPVAECAADRGKASPCCGQSADDFDNGPVPASYQCPPEQPVCLGYVMGSHLGKCETVNAVAAAVSATTVAAAGGQPSTTAPPTTTTSTTSTTTAAAAALGASLHAAHPATSQLRDLKVEVENRQEPTKTTNPAPDKVDTAFGDTGMLSVSSDTPMFKAGFTRGGLTAQGLQFVNGKGDRIGCASTAGAALTQNSNSNLKGFRGVEMTCAPASSSPSSSSSTAVAMDSGARSLRFRRVAGPADLAKSLAQPHGAPFHGGSWLPFNPSVGLVAWPTGNPQAYRLSYEGVFGCMSPATVGPFGASMCPPGALVGPFALQTPAGTPFFMPFPGVPAPAVGAAAAKP